MSSEWMFCSQYHLPTDLCILWQLFLFFIDPFIFQVYPYVGISFGFRISFLAVIKLLCEIYSTESINYNSNDHAENHDDDNDDYDDDDDSDDDDGDNNDDNDDDDNDDDDDDDDDDDNDDDDDDDDDYDDDDNDDGLMHDSMI